mmetsp:Transcript_38648/g.54401  ORF Transcript_38648/g.54401 Transcript_38648/m.54401 type:complete len:204 (+) Transcript_38648:17-628(+)
MTKSTTVSAEAFCSMALHAAQNPTTVVHGLLIGKFEQATTVQVSKAVPVCHETPTQPLIETAIALADASMDSDEAIVGWYTAPENVSAECTPGPVALRIAASLETADGEPVLMLIDNVALALCLKGEPSKDMNVLQALGKDFGKQWLELQDLVILNETSALDAAQSAFQQDSIKTVDLVDHFENATSTWFTNEDLTNHVAKCC